MYKNSILPLLVLVTAMTLSCPSRADLRLHLQYDEANGDPVVVEQVSGNPFYIRHENNPPERVPGVSGNAMRTDGYSTWLTGPLDISVGQQMTLSTWIALESYPSTDEDDHRASSILHSLGNNGFNLGIDTYGNWWFHIHIGGEARVVHAPDPFPLYEWTHVAARIDAGSVTLFINGVEQASESFPSGIVNLPNNGELVIGRSDQPQISHGVFEVNAMNAAYDETRIEATAVSQTELAARYNAGQHTPWEPSIAVPDSRFADDHLRPRYHAMPPANWTNEPHGLVEHEGRFHMFYQRTPNGPFKWMMHWGHMWTEDFVNWTNTRDAFYPRENSGGASGLGSKGIWSGDVIMDNGWAHAFYTTVNYDGNYNPGIAWATNSDGTLEDWTLHGGIIDKNDPNPGNILDFRDPYLWHSDGRWHMIIGAATQNGGGLEYYHTTHLGGGYWERANSFTSVPYSAMDPDSGIWEMPVFEYIGTVDGIDKYVLVVSPIGGAMQKNHAPYVRSMYWVGTWHVDGTGVGEFVPDFTQPKNLDVIHGHLSPSVTRQDGELVAIGIVDERTNSQMQNDLGWAHVFSLPVNWRLLEDGETIGQTPHVGLKKLRDVPERYFTENLNVTGDHALGFNGNQAEVTVYVDPDNTASSYGFYIAASPDMEEVTRIYYDGDNIVIDKSSSSNFSGLEEVGVYSGNYDEVAFGKPEKFQVFIDHSIVTVFINDKAAFHNRIYPSRTDSTRIGLMSSGGSTLFTAVEAFPLGSQEAGQTVDTLTFDFESGDLGNWTILWGDAFTDEDVTDESCFWAECYSFEREGSHHFWGYKNGGDERVGAMRTPTFTVAGDGMISLLIGGGNNIETLYVALIDEVTGQEVDRVTGTDSEVFSQKELNGSACVGQLCYLKAVDNETDGFGHLNLDSIQIPVVEQHPVEIRRYDFESGDLSGWTVISGDAFSDGDVTSDSCFWVECIDFEREGSYHFWGYKNGGDERVGEMRTETFVLSGDGIIEVLIGGGSDISNLYLALVDSGTGAELKKITGDNNEVLTRKQLNGSAYVGQTLYLKAVDTATGGFGHLNLDGIQVPVVP